MHRRINAEAAHLRIMGTSRLLTVLKADSRAIFTAAAAATRACDYLRALQPGAAAQPDDDEDSDLAGPETAASINPRPLAA